MNSRLRLTPPKQRLAERSGSTILPMRLPSGANTTTPSWPSPMPQPHHRLPSTSQRKPSGVSPCAQATKTRLLASFVPLSTTSNTRITRDGSPASTTYMRLSSGEKQSPFRSEEHTSELQSHVNLVCRLLL